MSPNIDCVVVHLENAHEALLGGQIPAVACVKARRYRLDGDVVQLCVKQTSMDVTLLQLWWYIMDVVIQKSMVCN